MTGVRSPYSARTLTPPTSLRPTRRSCRRSACSTRPWSTRRTRSTSRSGRSTTSPASSTSTGTWWTDACRTSWSASVRSTTRSSRARRPTGPTGTPSSPTGTASWPRRPTDLRRPPVFVAGLISPAASRATKCAAAMRRSRWSSRASTTRVGQVRATTSSGKAATPHPTGVRPAGRRREEQFSYDGSGGVPVASLWRRMLYGLHFREANFLLSDVFNEKSKVIYVRDPRERVSGWPRS